MGYTLDLNAQRAGAPAALHRADLSPGISAEGRVLPGPSPEPTECPTPFGAELGACSSTPRAWERTQERRRPAPAPRAAEPPLRTLEPSSLPPRQPLGSATKVWVSEKRASVGTLTGTLLDPQERPEPLPFYLTCPPRTGQLPEALGGSGLWPCLPHPLKHAGQDGSQLVCVASFNLLQTHKEPPGL